MLRFGAVLRPDPSQLEALLSDPLVTSVALDSPVTPLMAVTAKATGADQAWAGVSGLPGLTGRGVGVAVIDSGIAEHRHVADRIAVNVDFVNGGGRGIDQYGHGTHVAGIIAGAGTGGYGGVAPGANLVNLRAPDDTGAGFPSDVIRAIDWPVDNAARHNIRVINLSLGHPVMQSWRDDPLVQGRSPACRF